jgi:uncharacterized membrane protein HdeD (DUF308 family)
MAPIAMIFGTLLVLLGIGLYFATGAATALIPAYFGIALDVLGVLARNEKLRMHAMHGAALIGLIGFVMPAIMVIKGLMSEVQPSGWSMGGQIGMSVLCAVFLGLCIKSFIDARIARKRKEAEAQTK